MLSPGYACVLFNHENKVVGIEPFELSEVEVEEKDGQKYYSVYIEYKNIALYIPAPNWTNIQFFYFDFVQQKYLAQGWAKTVPVQNVISVGTSKNKDVVDSFYVGCHEVINRMNVLD